MNTPGIYKIQSIIKPDHVYIGSAINIKQRWNQHLNMLRKCNHHSRKLQRHYLKYGESDLQFSILIKCEANVILDFEQFYINSYKPYFNTCSIAGSQLGVKASDEAKINISNGHKGQKAWNKGKIGCYSKETTDKISHGLTGKKQSQETINKRIEKIKRTWELKRSRNEHHPKNIVWNKGRTEIYSEITLQKIRNARKNQIFTQETQDKKSESMKKTLALKRMNNLKVA